MTEPVKQMIKAAKSGDSAHVQALLAADPSLAHAQDGDGSTPLHYASWKGHVAVAETLLAAGADIHAQNRNGHWGTTPLHAAAHGNQRAVAELLLAHGADVNAHDPDGHTPLDETRVHNATAVAKILRAHGADGG